MEQSKSIYDNRESIRIIFDGKLKDEIIKRASLEGFNNEVYQWLKNFVTKLWELK